MQGNRTFNGLPDEELYIAIPRAKWDARVRAAGEIATANATMGAHYEKHVPAVRG